MKIRTLVNTIVSDKLDTFLEENPQVGRMILDKALTANRAREAAKKGAEIHPPQNRAGRRRHAGISCGLQLRTTPS